MDRIRFRCTSCNRELSALPEAAGKVVRCPDCGASQRAPGVSSAPTSAEPKLGAPAPPVQPPATPEPASPPYKEPPPFAGRDAASPGGYRYEAFISYRHVEPDRKWAKWLHRKLETYRVPRRLVKERGVAPRIRRIFRDEEELPASADLNKEIEVALKESRFLIVVCSPRTPESEWVNKEVVQFREMGRHDHILALLIEGEPGESFPRSLREIRRLIATERGMTRERIEEVEPLAADVRPSRTDSRRHLRRMAKLRMLACILGCRFDDLRQRERERALRRRSLLASLAACFLLILLGLAAYTNIRITAERDRA